MVVTIEAAKNNQQNVARLEEVGVDYLSVTVLFWRVVLYLRTEDVTFDPSQQVR